MKNKIIALLLIMTISVGALFSGFEASASYQSEIDELESKKNEINNQISTIKSDISKKQQLKNALQSEIDILQEQIDIYNGQITELDNKILELNEKKAVFEKDFNEKKKVFLKRVRAMYISGSTDNELSVLLGAENFGDYLYHSELLERVTESDNQIIDELKKDISEIESIESEVQKQVDQITPLKSSVVTKQNELNDVMKEYNATISKLEGEQSKLQMTAEEYQAQINELKERIKADIAAKTQNNNSDSNSGNSDNYTDEYNTGNYESTGQFIWPCPNYYTVTSEMGWRNDPWPEYHSGMDISGGGIYGAPVIAADGGTVIVSEYYGGYGNCVMIDHGNGLVSLYGHMSGYAVSEGQSVAQGQTVGYVGSTGWSTGPHLHFEVRVNGTEVNPRNYL